MTPMFLFMLGLYALVAIPLVLFVEIIIDRIYTWRNKWVDNDMFEAVFYLAVFGGIFVWFITWSGAVVLAVINALS